MYFDLEFIRHVSSICFMAIESDGICITSGSLLCEAFHLYNSTNCLQWNILWILWIIGRCLNILQEGPCSLHHFFIPHINHAHILDTSVCLHMHLYIKYSHSNMHGMICAKYPHFQHFLFLYTVVGNSIIT